MSIGSWERTYELVITGVPTGEEPASDLLKRIAQVVPSELSDLPTTVKVCSNKGDLSTDLEHLRDLGFSGLIVEKVTPPDRTTSDDSKPIVVSRTSLSPEEIRLLDGPWYHDFSALGIPTRSITESKAKNQRCKQKPLFHLIDRALTELKLVTDSVSVLELFSSDAFYGQYALRRGANSLHAIDRSKFEIERATLMASLLGTAEQCSLTVGDVFAVSDTFTLCICAGGLYHLENPESLLRKLREHVSGVLIVQTVFSLAETDPEYFETPAPLWTWGCRFSLEYLYTMARRAGWKIKYRLSNQLEGNDRAASKGSAYLFLV